MPSSPSEFHGWLGHDSKAASGNMTWSPFKPKSFRATDVDIHISHCGICGSDIHTLRSGWKSTRYPVCVGHEIAGRVVRVGAQVKHLAAGDRVGVGAQAGACLECADCRAGLEQHCSKMVGTYNGTYPDGSVSMGGYADYARVPARFAVRIPEGLRSEDAAPMMCGGVTVYSALVRNGAGPGVRVGIVGLGGLGHFGVLFAKALGCERVVVISRRRGKEEDAREMGADDFVATAEDDRWARTHARSLDLIISTVSSPDMPLESYLRLLRTNGTFIQVGAPEDKLPRISAYSLIQKGVKIGGSNIGSPRDIEEMLAFAALKQVRPWVQLRSMKDANQSVVDMEEGRARYRYVLVNADHEDRAKL